MLRHGKTAAPAAGGDDGPSSSSAAGKSAAPVATVEPSWFSTTSVKVIVVLLGVFFLLHLFMWYIVYGHMRDRFDDSLRQSVRLAWEKVKEVVDHL